MRFVNAVRGLIGGGKPKDNEQASDESEPEHKFRSKRDSKDAQKQQSFDPGRNNKMSGNFSQSALYEGNRSGMTSEINFSRNDSSFAPESKMKQTQNRSGFHTNAESFAPSPYSRSGFPNERSFQSQPESRFGNQGNQSNQAIGPNFGFKTNQPSNQSGNWNPFQQNFGFAPSESPTFVGNQSRSQTGVRNPSGNALIDDKKPQKTKASKPDTDKSFDEISFKGSDVSGNSSEASGLEEDYSNEFDESLEKETLAGDKCVGSELEMTYRKFNSNGFFLPEFESPAITKSVFERFGDKRFLWVRQDQVARLSPLRIVLRYKNKKTWVAIRTIIVNRDRKVLPFDNIPNSDYLKVLCLFYDPKNEHKLYRIAGKRVSIKDRFETFGTNVALGKIVSSIKEKKNSNEAVEFSNFFSYLPNLSQRDQAMAKNSEAYKLYKVLQSPPASFGHLTCERVGISDADYGEFLKTRDSRKLAFDVPNTESVYVKSARSLEGISLVQLFEEIGLENFTAFMDKNTGVPISSKQSQEMKIITDRISKEIQQRKKQLEKQISDNKNIDEAKKNHLASKLALCVSEKDFLVVNKEFNDCVQKSNSSLRNRETVDFVQKLKGFTRNSVTFDEEQKEIAGSLASKRTSKTKTDLLQRFKKN